MNNNKIALVTGANRGIGYEACRQLILAGFTLILTARNAEKGRAAVEALKATTNNNNIHFHALDLISEADMDALVQYVQTTFGRLDVLVNNAGIIINGDDTTTVSKANLQATLDTNFFGPFLMSQKFLPLLKASPDGRIINVSSGMGALHGMGGGYAAYRISKTALNSLTAVMAADVSATNVKVFTNCPGWVHTDLGGANAPRTPEQGANGITWLATNDEVVSGKFYRDGKIIEW